MTRRKWVMTTSTVLIILLLLTGGIAIAAEYGSDSDPLLPASYITDVLAPETIEQVNETIEEKTQQIQTDVNQTLADFSAELEEIIADFEARNENLSNNTDFIDAIAQQVADLLGVDYVKRSDSDTDTASASSWYYLLAEEGKTYVFVRGGMILPCSGSMECYTAGNTGLTDVTSGSIAGNGESLDVNHMYIVTASEGGFTVSGSKNALLVSGSYSVQ